MEHRTEASSSKIVCKSARVRAIALLLFAAMGSLGLSGCSLFVMAGKMIMGDTMVTSAFHQATDVDLTKGEKSIIIVCDAPESAKENAPSLDFEIMDGTMRRLKREGVKMIDPNKVASWLDDNGGFAGDVNEIAQEFDVDYIIRIDIDTLTFNEENSTELFRGNAVGTVFAYEVQKSADGTRHIEEVLSREYVSTYPSMYPIDNTRTSEKVFRKRYLDRVCTQLANMLHDHKMSDEMD